MTAKILQVEMDSEIGTKDLETSINKFLIERKLTRNNLIDIKLARSDEYKTVLIIYEVDLEEKK